MSYIVVSFVVDCGLVPYERLDRLSINLLYLGYPFM